MGMEGGATAAAARVMRAEGLLATTSLLRSKHEAHAAASGQNFNLFQVLGREADEVGTHSAILAELLRPKGSHGQGAVFAWLFAKRLRVDGAKLEDAQVWTEASFDSYGRLDILLQSRERETCVVIENKIYADDQPGQLERYRNYVRDLGWRHSRVVYLTLHGDEPTKQSLGGLKPEDVMCMSYESDVIEWLDDCIKEVARVPQIREILAHYQALLRKLTGKVTGELTVELKELLGNKSGGAYNFELMPDLHQAMTELSVETEWTFWQSLREKLEVKGDRTWGLDHLEIRDSPDGLKDVTQAVVRHTHSATGRNKWGYGWTFRVKSETADDLFRAGHAEILLRVASDDGDPCVYCGLIAVESTPDGGRWLDRDSAPAMFEDWAQRVSKAKVGWHTTDNRWLAWANHPRSGGLSMRKQTWFPPETMRSLRDDNDMIVDEFVREIRNALEKIVDSGLPAEEVLARDTAENPGAGAGVLAQGRTDLGLPQRALVLVPARTPAEAKTASHENPYGNTQVAHSGSARAASSSVWYCGVGWRAERSSAWSLPPPGRGRITPSFHSSVSAQR